MYRNGSFYCRSAHICESNGQVKVSMREICSIAVRDFIRENVTVSALLETKGAIDFLDTIGLEAVLRRFDQRDVIEAIGRDAAIEHFNIKVSE
jgi:hypothetical protein